MSQKLKSLSVFCLTLVMVLASVQAWTATTKTISLVKGWNLINTPVQPDDSSAETVLNGLDYVSAWKWVNGKWAVLLKDQDTQEYASSKGFQVLSTINAGEGFWLNMNSAGSLTITGNAPSTSNLYFVQGWNLVGLKTDAEKNITDIVPDNAISAWKWQNGNWAVWLPDSAQLQEYASSKGFDILEKVSATDGFWINAGEPGVVGTIETPPQAGKAYEVAPDNEITPLANADVYLNGEKIGVTDDQGLFDLPENVSANDKIEIKTKGYTVGVAKVVDGVLFVQKLDSKLNVVGSNYNSATDSFEKPTPKVLSSSDGATHIVVGENMKLKKDITVSITTYKSPIAAPAYKNLGLNNIEPGKDVTDSLVVIGGASLEVLDSNGVPTILTEDDFSASIKAATTKILGGIGEALNAYEKSVDEKTEKLTSAAYQKIKDQIDAGLIKLYTMYLDADKVEWKVAGPAKIQPYTIKKKLSNGTIEEYTRYALVTGDGVSLPTFTPFAFVLKHEKLIGKVKFKVVEGGYKMFDGSIVTTSDSNNSTQFDWVGKPIEGVLCTADEDAAVEAKLTNSTGQAELKYKVPFFSPVIDFLFKKEGYFDTAHQQDVKVYYDNGKPEIVVTMYRIPETASIEGYVREKLSNDPIGGALVSLMNPDVLDQVDYAFSEDDGIILSVEYKPNCTYKWEYKQANATTWKTLLEGTNSSAAQITGKMVRDTVIDKWDNSTGADPTGMYDLRVTVTHQYSNNAQYVEQALGHFEVLVDQNKLKELVTASLSEEKKGTTSKIGIYGGAELGWYEAVGTIANDYEIKWTTKIQSLANETGFDSDVNVEQDPFSSELFPTYINVIYKSAPYEDAFYPYNFVLSYLTQNFMTLLQSDPYNNNKPYFQSGFTVANYVEYRYKGGDGQWTNWQTAATYFDLPEDAITNPRDLLLIPKLEIMPNTTFAYLRQIYSKDDGFYRFNLIPAEYNEKLEVSGEQVGYKPDYKLVNDLETGKVSHYDLYLEKIEQPGKEIAYNFEDPSSEGQWTAGSNNTVKWQYLTNPESVKVADYFVNYASYPDEVESDVYVDYDAVLKKDANGTIVWKDKDKNIAYLTANGTDYEVYLYLDNDNNTIDVQSVDQTQGIAWIDANGNFKFTIMGDGTPTVTLLPAFEGKTNLWFGNKELGVFMESDSSYISGTYNEYIESPVIDLTNFSFAKLQFMTWFEAESVDIAKGQFDQMYIEVSLADDTTEPVTIKSPYGSYTLTPGEWKVVDMMNPDYEPGWANQDPKLNYTNVGPDAAPMWSERIVNLAPFAGHKIKLRFRFNTNDGLFNYFRGWAIDDLKIINEPLIELPPAIDDAPTTPALGRVAAY